MKYMYNNNIAVLRFALCGLFFWGLCTASMLAQAPPQLPVTFPKDTNDVIDTTDVMNDLDPEKFVAENDFLPYSSVGFFPTPYPMRTLALVTGPYWLINSASGIRPRGTVPVFSAFSRHNPFSDNDLRQITKKNAKDDYEGSYPECDYRSIGLSFSVALPVPAILRVYAGYNRSESVLFAEDRTRSYLSTDGIKTGFQEVNILYKQEKFLHGGIGVDIPIRGGFVKMMDELSIAQYTYVRLGIAGDYKFSSRTTQYVQIADAKQNLRYGNGRDTLRLVDGIELSDIQRLRPMVELALGFSNNAGISLPRFGSLAVQLNAELFGYLPLVGVLNDGSWKEYVVGFRFSFGYQWVGK